jgi:hypothetical protein
MREYGGVQCTVLSVTGFIDKNTTQMKIELYRVGNPIYFIFYVLMPKGRRMKKSNGKKTFWTLLRMAKDESKC